MFFVCNSKKLQYMGLVFFLTCATCRPNKIASDLEPTSVSAPFNISATIQQIRFSFRETSAGFEGGQGTFGIKANRNGQFSFTPYYYEEKKAQKKSCLHGRDLPARTLRIPPRKGSPAKFETVAITRNNQSLAPENANALIGPKGELVIARGPFIEKLLNSNAGVEQSWTFDKPPPEQGELIIRIRVSGQEYAGLSEQGLHFLDPNTGLGTRYGWGTWIDAKGKRTEIRGQWIANHIVLEVPTELVDTSSYPAVLDPLVSPEFGMDDQVMGPAPDDQLSEGIGFDGTNYLVTWDDFRNGNDYNIYGARVSQDGEILDTSGFAICDVAENQYWSRVAFDGTNYWVVWHDQRYFDTKTNDIYGTRVSTDGNVLDGASTSVAISTGNGLEQTPDIECSATNCMVVWEDWRNGNRDIYGARVNSSGAVLDGAGIAMSTDTAEQSSPSIAFDSTNYLVVWEDSRSGLKHIYGTRISTAGAVQDGSGQSGGFAICTAASGAQTLPDVTFGTSNYFVVWQDSRNIATSGMDIYGTRITPAAGVLDGVGAGIGISTITDCQVRPAVTHNGTNFFVAWGDCRNSNDYDIYGARVNSSGTVLDASGIAISTALEDQYETFIASDGTNVLVTWTDQRNAVTDIYGTRVSNAGIVLDSASTGISIATALI
ncbi:MAG: hypothetical protein V1754_03960, partial [Pseudomonadota bacterium]